jgi:hypothetical protein
LHGHVHVWFEEGKRLHAEAVCNHTSFGSMTLFRTY